MRHNFYYLVFCTALFTIPLAAHSDDTMSGDQLKALINGKTVHVTVIKNGKTWSMYHAPDGKSYDSRGGEGKWYISDQGEHCNEAPKVKFKCGKVVDKGDGVYIRLNPSGDPIVKWSNIVDGKDF